jgi:hypothetical protein
MKKTLFLTLAAGLIGASPLMAASFDLYITGSTAFRANVHDAVKKLFDVTPVDGTSLFYGTSAQFGNGAHNNGNPQWVMTGTVSGKISAMGANTLTVHGFFTGSVQGIQTVENLVPLTYLTAANTLTTNTPTIAFTDASSLSTPFPATGNFAEEKVCVQPFVMCKSVVTSGGVTNISNVTWEQLKYAIQIGRIPASAWSNKTGDHSNYVYLVERSKDSGTRRTQNAQELDGYNQAATIYLYDQTNNFWYNPTNSNPLVWNSVGWAGSPTNSQVIGTAGPGFNNANLGWGAGYIGGGDIKAELGLNNSNNQAMAYLSIADAKGITGVNWSQVVSFNALWPTAAGAGISGNTGTNDYSPISEGVYTCWGYEVVVYPTVDPSTLSTDQNLSQTQLGNQQTAGTILGVLDSQTLINGGSPLAGSLENEIELSKPNGATAIRLSDMTSVRSSVGGTITP